MKTLFAVVLLVAGCRKQATPVLEDPALDEVETAAPFRVEVNAPPSCVQNAPCKARVELTALGKFKVNEAYPTKFVADQGQQIESTFVRSGDKRGTLELTVHPAAAGNLRVSGTFKLSVCTPKVCKSESPKIELVVPVT